MDPAVDLALRGALALLFGAAAFHKARDLPAFRSILADYRLVPHSSVPIIAAFLIALEAALAAALPLPVWHGPTAWAAVALLALYTGAIAVNLARGRRHIDCGCGGPALRQPLGPWLLLRNGCLVLGALVAAGPPASRPLVPLDVLTVMACVTSLSLLYTAAGQLFAVRPGHGRLRRVS